jgi:hypothetical protein
VSSRDGPDEYLSTSVSVKSSRLFNTLNAETAKINADRAKMLGPKFSFAI